MGAYCYNAQSNSLLPYFRAFNTICYSADGKCILAAGRSKNVCIYSVEDQLIIKKFEITCNMSFDGMEVRFLSFGKILQI
jgi:hypothetical protein